MSKRKSTLSRRAAEAAEHGVSYGKWVATEYPDLPEAAAEEAPAENTKPQIGTVTCAWCGREFPIYDHHRHKFCSEACRYEAQKERSKTQKQKKQEEGNMKASKEEMTVAELLPAEPTPTELVTAQDSEALTVAAEPPAEAEDPAGLQAKLTKAENALYAADQQLARQEAEIADLKTKLTESKRLLAKAAANAESWETRLRAMDKDLTEAVHALAYADADAKDADEELQKCKGYLQKCERERAEAQAQLDRIDRLREGDMQVIDRLQADNDRLTRRYQTLAAAVVGLVHTAILPDDAADPYSDVCREG